MYPGPESGGRTRRARTVAIETGSVQADFTGEDVDCVVMKV